MCDVNHKGFARPGYLIDVRAESVAAEGALWTRALAHHDQVGLSDGQIRQLLDLSREYHAAQQAVRLRMAVLGEQVEQKGGRLDSEALAVRKPLLDERAELFRVDEELFFTFAARGQELLTDEQLEVISDVYHSEKDEGLSALAVSLDRAVGPNFFFGPVPVQS
jgi:hypothetical protein